MSRASFTDAALERLAALGLALPVPPPPAGRYAPFRLDRGVGWLSAQYPTRDGKPVLLGRVGLELSAEQGREACMLAALNALARIHEALDGFDRLRGLLRVEGHVASSPGFVDQPAVLDGASDLFNAVLGERGRHARLAFAPAQLPYGISIELAIAFAYDERAQPGAK